MTEFIKKLISYLRLYITVKKKIPKINCYDNFTLFNYYSLRIKSIILLLLRRINENEFKQIKTKLNQKKSRLKKRLGIAYNVFDGYELLESSIKTVRDEASFIVVVYQLISNYGEKADKELEETLFRLKQNKLIDELYCYTPNLKDPQACEREKRDIGLILAKRARCKYYMDMDCDEFYLKDQLRNALDYIQYNKIACSAVSIIEYIKKPTYQLANGYIFSPHKDYIFYCPFIMKIFKFKYNLHSNKNFSCLVDPTRGLNAGEKFYLFSKHDVAMHHMSTIRKNLEKKFNNSNLNKGANRSTIKSIQDEIIKFDYEKNIEKRSIFNGIVVNETDNIFDIPEMTIKDSTIKNK